MPREPYAPPSPCSRVLRIASRPLRSTRWGAFRVSTAVVAGYVPSHGLHRLHQTQLAPSRTQQHTFVLTTTSVYVEVPSDVFPYHTQISLYASLAMFSERFILAQGNTIRTACRWFRTTFQSEVAGIAYYTYVRVESIGTSYRLITYYVPKEQKQERREAKRGANS